MSEQKDGGAPAPVKIIVTTAREHEADRKKAKHRHWTHYRTQTIAWGAVIAAAMLCIPYQHWYRQSCQDSCSGLNLRSVEHYVGLFLPAMLLLLIFALNCFYRWLRLHDWEVALGNAQQAVSPHNVTRGYTDLFNIYMRTKRRSYLLAACGILAFAYAISGMVMNLHDSVTSLYGVIQIAEIALGIALFWLGYNITSSYLPGEVIVRHILALSILAISNVTNVEEARMQAEKDAADFVRDNPWWFYPG